MSEKPFVQEKTMMKMIHHRDIHRPPSSATIGRRGNRQEPGTAHWENYRKGALSI